MWSRIVALAACGAALAGCSSSSWTPSWSTATSWMPSMSMPSFSGGGGGASGAISVESDPPGAEAKSSTGSSCRTPCTLTVTANRDFTVTFALNGYQPATLPVAVITPPLEDSRDYGGDSGVRPNTVVRFEPNPVFAELTPAPGRRRPPPPAKPRVSSRPASQPALAADPDASTSAQYPAGSTPWPTPR